jgi:hypothetical protein
MDYAFNNSKKLHFFLDKRAKAQRKKNKINLEVAIPILSANKISLTSTEEAS